MKWRLASNEAGRHYGIIANVKRAIYSAFLFLIVIACFIGARSFGIIQLDDYQYIPGHFGDYGLKWAFTWAGDGMWTPLTWLSYMLDYAVFGENWECYHLHSIMLHGLSAVVFFFLLRHIATRVGMGNSDFVSFLAALLWALHPLRVESVVWLASRKDMISTLFLLAAFLLWAKSKGNLGLLTSVLLILVGGLGKNSVMVFPAFAMAYDYAIERKRKPYWSYVLITLISLAYAAVASWAQGKGDAYTVTEGVPFLYRVFNAVAGLSIYLRNTVWPFDLAVQCQLQWPKMPRFSLIGFVLLLGFVWLFVTKAKECWESRQFNVGGALVFALVYFAVFVPFIGLTGFGSHAFADRFTILPSLALSIAFVLLVKDIARPKPLLCLASLVAVLLAARTIHQVGYWKDDKTLFEHTLAVDGDGNMVAHKVLLLDAWEYDHDFDRVFQHGYAALNASPWQSDMIMVMSYLGLEAAYETGRKEEAEDIFGATLKWSARKVAELKREMPNITVTDTELICDAVRLAYTEGQLDYAKKKVAELEKAYPNQFGVLNLRYILARRGGDPAEIAEAKKKAYAPKGEAFVHNRWALK